MAANPKIRDWTRQRVWVIGASSGIGAATARMLLARGARVALSARRGEELLRIAADAPERALALPLDVTDAAALARALSDIDARWSGIDFLIVAAGDHRPMRAWDLDLAEARRILELNVMGVLNCVAAVLPRFLERGAGGIAIVSSVAGYRGLPTSLAYGASKAALINFAETLYLDLQPKGIGVYLVNPGFVRTPLTDRNEFPMPALIEPEQAAREILDGMGRGLFEIHFPKRFTRFMKLLRILPHGLYVRAVRALTGG